MTDLTLGDLRSLLAYDSETGEFTWRVTRGSKAREGDRAGTVERGRVRIRIKGQAYLASRLAWFYTYGKWPDGVIDHKDERRWNDAIANLRDIPNEVNLQNRSRPRCDNRSGYLGVSPQGPAFLAHIGVNGTQKYLGRFATAKLAHEAYQQAKREIHAGWIEKNHT